MSIFEVKKAKDGQFFFRLKAANGETILASEMYKAPASALNGVESVKKNATNAERFEKKTTAKKQAFFVLKAGNHEVIGTSEMYTTETARDAGIAAVMKIAPSATVNDLTNA
jgi:uncharacterized protein